MTTFKSIAKTPPPPVVVPPPPARKRVSGRVALRCNECERKYSVSINNPDPQCPKCGSVDFEVA